jgi:hypothetical protein
MNTDIGFKSQDQALRDILRDGGKEISLSEKFLGENRDNYSGTANFQNLHSVMYRETQKNTGTNNFEDFLSRISRQDTFNDKGLRIM